jgi:FkbM family methyltransferase
MDYYHSILALGKKPVIVDAGANSGASSIWFAREFPEAEIVAIEPDPDNADLFALNTAGFPNVRLLRAAIGSAPGYVTLTTEAEGWSVRSRRSEAGVPVVTVADAIAGVGPDARPFLCKIDIEGFESDLFADHVEWVDDQAVIMIELHDWMATTQGTSLTCQRALMGKGDMLVSGEKVVFVKPAAA